MLFIILLIFFSIQLRRSKEKRLALSSSQQSKHEEDFASLTRVLLCVSTIFIICNLLNGAVNFLVMWNNPGDWEPADVEIFSCIPLILNSSVNFVIYGLLGKKFRLILKQILQKWLKCCRMTRGNREQSAESTLQIELSRI